MHYRGYCSLVAVNFMLMFDLSDFLCCFLDNCEKAKLIEREPIKQTDAKSFRT